ncbi:exodeoxyribonuclease I [Hydrocarboniclastica marina]|uniref:Exodeoxyribonuclease I n=1 Tax=Hydrocarboniclastica marina TaxID=2259620 RepID=A0A4P7XLU2_9ALTE|nr:exodeoxyribonuclease I [Hydrocarboniclastica marina]
MLESFLWHDYETFGADPLRDRPAQFAAIRTDTDLNIIDEPMMFYCRPADDYVPDPRATLITGITPQKALEDGLCEAEFISRVNEAFAVPGTCGAGYNSIRFDDEVTRHTLYRNLRDPYGREWQNGCCRWDIIDVVRLTYALRPEGIEWPRKPDGAPSFRLEDLTQANGIAHESAHDAMSDVYATIAVARLIRERQPRLYDYCLGLRDKKKVLEMLDTTSLKPVLHVSSRYPASSACAALVAPLAMHPTNRNAVIVYDLREDPTDLLEASVEDIQARVFVAAADLPEGQSRYALKAVHANKCPAIAPASLLKSLSEEQLQGIGLERNQLRRNLKLLRQSEDLPRRVQEAFGAQQFAAASDPDEMLYGGGFLSPQDRKQLDFVLAQPVELLGELDLNFTDQRLPEMLFRYRARNFPQTLDGEEQERWEAFRQERLLKGGPGWRTLPQYFEVLKGLDAQDLPAPQRLLLQDLQFYGESLIPYG